ncbi:MULTISPECIES: leucine efflux protein LeuE [Pseudomonas]|nr:MULTISPECIES: leucine efflux protein LeuE [Pseudomonas]KES24321.1 membrane protein [Pseudomonas sp. AAC]MBH3432348.1 leucine efflux protein LeuE [Pseudomonas citronellolis]MDF3841681.1 leucine efflux protein LeuE [Pseudomonas citronellolis]NTX91257.1 leucine efflux protein LeuE [Pseudomonas sp. UMA643]NTY17806.1 leucine efflux protein LeuE [Pseudomonas sp. UMC3103]
MPTLGITDLWTYVLGTLFIVLLPGPNSLFVLATAAQRGVGAGYRAASAVFLGDAILMLLSALGIASLLKAEPVLFLGLKYAGAAYLFYLGLGMLRGGLQKLRQPLEQAAPAKEVDVAQPFRKALLLSLSNPKAILFFVSFFIQFVDPGYAYPGVSFLVLGTILEVISALYLSFLIFSGVRLAAWFRRRQRLAAGASSGVGALFVGFGVKLASATLS